MKEKQRNGPYRMVLLNCGKFDYAEVELDSPIHLIGPNNVGKTSLIALLQFLYVDTVKSMAFSRDTQETKKYYFPGKYSFVLFECLTVRGRQVLGVNGLGPMRQYNYERFIYAGKLDTDDFLDEERRTREPEDIFKRLSVKDLRHPLKPKHLRAALTGSGESRDSYLGLAPERHSGDYQRFKRVFGNILRLAHVRQDELKQLLLDIYQHEFQQQEIDLAKNYAEGFETVKQHSAELEDLKRIQAEIEKLIQHRRARDEARKILPPMWEAIGNIFEEKKSGLDLEKKQLQAHKSELSLKQDELSDEIKKLREQQRQYTKRQAVLEADIKKLSQKRESFKDFVPEWKQARLAEVENRLDQLAYRLADAQQESPDRLKKRLDSAEKKLAVKKRQLKNHANAAVNQLRRYLSDDDIIDAFSVLNPQMLSLPVNTDSNGISTDDGEAAVELLQALLEKREGDKIITDDIEIDLEALTPPAMEDYSDPKVVKEQIDWLQREIQRLRDTLHAARKIESLRKEKNNLQKERREIDRCLEKYAEFREEEKNEPDWKEELNQLDEKEKQIEEKIKGTEKEQQKIKETIRQNNDRLKEIDTERNELQKNVRELTAPDEDWPSADIEDLPTDWDTLLRRYKQKYNEQSEENKRVGELLDIIDRHTYGKYSAENEDSTLKALTEQLESIPEREKAVQDMWQGIAAGVKQDIKNIGKDLEKLKGLVTALNKQIGQFDISNLESLVLIVKERPRLTKRIRDITVSEDMPLFAESGSAEKALADMGKLLSEYPKIEVKELFDLSFEITTPDGNNYRHDHLDNIESNGTTIAIKVLVNLALLAAVLKGQPVQVPFYLDECSSLDRENLISIVKAAREMGFIAVLASPEAMDVAEKLYFIEENEKGRVVLDPDTSRIKINREQTATADT